MARSPDRAVGSTEGLHTRPSPDEGCLPLGDLRSMQWHGRETMPQQEHAVAWSGDHAITGAVQVCFGPRPIHRCQINPPTRGLASYLVRNPARQPIHRPVNVGPMRCIRCVRCVDCCPRMRCIDCVRCLDCFRCPKRGLAPLQTRNETTN